MGIFNFRRRKFHERSAERHACQIAARVVMCDSGVSYDGLIQNISIGGAMFRPALQYLLERKFGEIFIQVDGIEIKGEIMGTSPHGYGVRFDKPMSDGMLARMLERSVLVTTRAA